MLKDRAIDFIQQPHSKPYFLSLQFTAPHWPWQGPDDLAYPDSVRMNVGGSPLIYSKMVKALDEAIGEIMHALDLQSSSKNTLVIFTSDNGGERYSDMGIFQGRKLSLWEGGIRVPAFVRWPQNISAGTQTPQVVVTMDWTATIAAAAGINRSNDFPLDGMNLLPMLTGNSKPVRRTIYWRTIERSKHKAIRDGDWKYLKDEKGEYLFNLSIDPAEKVNLRDKNPNEFERLKQKFAVWESSMPKSQ
jgi:arylsulfatase A-like enzyme